MEKCFLRIEDFPFRRGFLFGRPKTNGTFLCDSVPMHLVNMLAFLERALPRMGERRITVLTFVKRLFFRFRGRWLALSFRGFER